MYGVQLFKPLDLRIQGGRYFEVKRRGYNWLDAGQIEKVGYIRKGFGYTQHLHDTLHGAAGQHPIADGHAGIPLSPAYSAVHNQGCTLRYS